MKIWNKHKALEEPAAGEGPEERGGACRGKGGASSPRGACSRGGACSLRGACSRGGACSRKGGACRSCEVDIPVRCGSAALRDAGSCTGPGPSAAARQNHCRGLWDGRVHGLNVNRKLFLPEASWCLRGSGQSKASTVPSAGQTEHAVEVFLTTYSKTKVSVSLVWTMSCRRTMLACLSRLSRDAAAHACISGRSCQPCQAVIGYLL